MANPFSIGVTMSKEQTLALRRQMVPSTCVLHFEKAPMKVSFAQGQYLYDEVGIEYLDCVNCVAHVGHCHPTVVKAGAEAMTNLGAVGCRLSADTAQCAEVQSYVDTLRRTFPSSFDTFLFVSSASEANDLALRLAQLYTKGTEVVAVERSFHGSISLPNTISPRIHIKQTSSQIPDWVHVLSCPDLYCGKHREDDPGAVDKYCADAQAVIENIVAEKKRKISCLILESIMTIAGIIIPPVKWLELVYREIRHNGGVVIADEAQTGMGRCGSCWWGFQYHEVIPDIVTIGNGHPMAVVATRKSIASTLDSKQLESYTCDNVAAAIGNAVLQVIRKENLLLSARQVGSFLREGLKGLANDRKYIGDVRGVGMMIGVEIVFSKENRKPAKEIAEKVCYRMKDHKIILGNDGIHKNVLIIMPPMCFTCQNAHRLILTLGKVLETIEVEDDANWNQPSTSYRGNANIFNFPTATTSLEANRSFLSTNIFSESISLQDIGFDLDRPSAFTEMD